MIEDVIVGCALPEAKQGLNPGKLIAARAGLPSCIPGMTVNRFCSSGLQTAAIAAAQIECGMNDVLVAGGFESMSAQDAEKFDREVIPLSGMDEAGSPIVFDKDQGIRRTTSMEPLSQLGRHTAQSRRMVQVSGSRGQGKSLCRQGCQTLQVQEGREVITGKLSSPFSL